jgi:hypothetical protein
MNATNGKYPFERPVIILAAPRSGSTLLFETLTKSTDFWKIGGESHAVFESIDRFNPMMGMCDSNALSADNATPAIVAQIRLQFFQQLRNSLGQGFQSQAGPIISPPRLLEKTPKNALRVSLLNEIFPDALFIYLYRNPRENISSMMDAWQSGRFVTYDKLSGRGSPWSLLLPPGWQSYNDASLEQITAFQWRAANTAILSELSRLDRRRWMVVSYRQQAYDTVNTVKKICEFCDVSPDGILDSLSGGRLPLSQYTLTAPIAEKWHKNASALSKVMSDLRETVDYIRKTADGLPDAEFDLTIEPSLTRETVPTEHASPTGVDSAVKSGRN